MYNRKDGMGLPRYNVEYNGKWACFSTVVDAFITPFINEEQYESWRKEEYGRAGYSPVMECNLMTIQDAAFYASLNRPMEETVKCLLWAGISEKDIEKLTKEIKKYLC